jgi:BirA family biotin operon repressor/biotin-[acetyl-CoA-carboxylase] ligase
VIAIAQSAVPVVRRLERLGSVGSTNDVVRSWLAAGEPEICIARADRQTAGRGLLVSLGFRPAWLAPDHVWQLAATASLAMADAARDEAGLPDGAIRQKWPNDLVLAADDGSVRKLGGVLGETDGLGTPDPRAIVGLGLNADWPETDFPPELAATMTSLRAATGDRQIDTGRLFDGFVARLEAGIAALHAGRFAAADWIERQVTTGRDVAILLPDGSTESAVAIGVDPDSGALRVADTRVPEGQRSIVVGEIVHVRLTAQPRAGL